MRLKESERPGHGGFILAQAIEVHKARDRRS